MYSTSIVVGDARQAGRGVRALQTTGKEITFLYILQYILTCNQQRMSPITLIGIPPIISQWSEIASKTKARWFSGYIPAPVC